MAENKRISELAVATTPTGAEITEIVQGGANKQTTLQDIANLASGVVETIQAGTNVTVDATDPANPIVSASGGGGGAVDSVNGQTGVVVLDATNVGADPAGSAAAAQAASQPVDGDLTAIAALAPSNDDIIQRKAGAWTNRTMAQLAADLTALSSAFVETATIYVDAAGSDSTGVLGRADKPFLTITAALTAGAAVTSLRIKIGMGTFASPAQADLRGNLWLEGSGKPGYNNTNTTTAFAAVTITDPTALLGGTILRGQVFFQDKSNVHVTDLGVDCGSAYVTGGGTEGNQLIFISATVVAPWPLMTNIVIKNVTTLGRTAASAFHGIQIENSFKPIIENCDTYFSTHGIVLKTYGGIVNNVRCNFHTSNAVIFKTDTYAIGWISHLYNFEVQGGGGVRVEIGSGTTTGGINGCMISNGVLRSSTFGVMTISQTTSMAHYLTVSAVKVYGSSGIGFDIDEAQSALIHGNMAIACATGFRYVGTNGNSFGQIMDNIAEVCTTGFNIDGGSGLGSAFASNNAARGNTTGYVWGTQVYGSGNVGETNTTFQTGTLVYREQARVFFGSTTQTPTALVHINSGTTTLAPLKIASGSLLTTAEVSALEFLTDKWYGTITTGAARKEFTLNDIALTSGRVPFVTTNGRITDDADLTFDGTQLRTAALATAYVAKTALYTLTASDYTVEVTSGTHTQTLPTAVGISGRIYVITNSGAGVVTVATTSSQTFVNVTATPTTLTLNQFETATVQSNGANWLRI